MYLTPRHLFASTAVLATVLLALGALTRAATPTQQCARAKLKAGGKEIAGKMRCYRKAKKAGRPRRTAR